MTRLFRRLRGAWAPILVLAIGLAANTVLYSIVDTVLLRPLPFRDAEALVMCWERHPTVGRQAVSPPDFHDWQRRNHSFRDLAAYSTQGQYSVLWTGRDHSEPLRTAYTSANLFPLIGVQPVVGRLFESNDDRTGAAPVVVLSHGLWVARFEASTAAIGSTMVLDGTPHRILGVMPAGVALPSWADVWLPLAAVDSELPNARPSHTLEVVGRLRPGVSVRDADGDLRAVAAQLAREFPVTNGPTGAQVISLRENFVGNVTRPLWLLQAAAILVLLICCAHVAVFALVETARRRREMQVRAALGASPSQLFASAIGQALEWSLSAGLLSVLLAWLSSDVVNRGIAGLLPFPRPLTLDWRVLAFCCGCSLATALLFGVGTARSRVSAADLRIAARSIIGPRHAGGRVLIAIETALAVIVMICAAMLAQSLRQTLLTDPGFDATHLLAMRYRLPNGHQFEQHMFDQLVALPGVDGVATTSQAPLEPLPSRFWIEGRPDPPPGQFPVAQVRFVSPRFFHIAGLRLVNGRLPNDGGDPDRVWVNESFVRRHFPDGQAVGHHVQQGLFQPVRTSIAIAGVISDMRDLGLDRASEPTIYRIAPSAQGTLLVRTSRDGAELPREVRRVLLSIEPSAWVDSGARMETVFSSPLRYRALALQLVAVFAAFSCLLGAWSIQVVISRAIVERTREIGLRMAVGADRGDLILLFVRRQLAPVACGIGLGVPAALAIAEAMHRSVVGIVAPQPTVCIAATLIVIATAACAAFLPARRASRIDPIAALRAE